MKFHSHRAALLLVSNQRRSWVLGLVALILMVLTVYDYSRERAVVVQHPDVTQETVLQVPSGTTESLWRELMELRHLRVHGELIRQRYQTLASGYAELVAPLATLGETGIRPKERAITAIQSLLSPEVKIKDLLIEDQPESVAVTQWIEVTLSLTSGDSQAMAHALAALGDTGNGMAWRELAVGVDRDHHNISAKGKLVMLLVRQAE